MLGQGRPGQERAKEEKERLARLAIVSEGNFGVDPPTGSMSYELLRACMRGRERPELGKWETTKMQGLAQDSKLTTQQGIWELSHQPALKGNHCKTGL